MLNTKHMLVQLTLYIQTTVWLHNLDIDSNEVPLAHSVEYWDPELVAALETEPRAALSMMLVRRLTPHPSMSTGLTRVM